MLFKELAGVDAFPLCLNTTDVDEIVRIVEGVAPTFGGINLEDIAAPRCFEIERRLKESLDIPVFHDDQHGTAVVVLAALLNALQGRRQARGGRARRDGRRRRGRAGLREDHPRERRQRPDRLRHRRHPAPRTAPTSRPSWPRWPRARTRAGSTGTADDALKGADVVDRRLRARRLHGRRRAHDGHGRDRVRDGQPDARGPARGGLGATSRSWPPAAATTRTRSTTCWRSRASSAARSTCAPAASTRR